MDNQVLDSLKRKLDKVIEVFGEDLNTIRTGRAKPDLLGGLDVMAYGQKMKLFELANITAPDPSLILVTPWDKSVVRDIEKAISESQLHLSANVSGEMIRVPIPSLTEERRRDFVKLLHQKMESGRIMVRQARGDVKEDIDAMKKQPGVSEDDVERLLEELQKVTDQYMDRVEEMGKRKEEEIMEV